MGKNIVLISLLALSLMLTGCSTPSGTETGEEAVKKERVEIPKDKEGCLSAGGQWRKIGIAPRESCNLKTGDFREVCNDSSECEGSCLAELSAEELAKVKKHQSVKTSGTCSEWRVIVGCRTFVREGKVDAVTCVD